MQILLTWQAITRRSVREQDHMRTTEDCTLLHRAFASEHHDKRSGSDEDRSERRLPGEVLVEEDKGKDEGEDDAELVDGHHLRDVAVLQSLVVAEPGGAGRKPRKYQEYPAFPRDP